MGRPLPCLTLILGQTDSFFLRVPHTAQGTSPTQQARDHNLSPHEIADALYNLGSDLELRGSLDEAEQVLQQALQLDARDPSALCERSEVFGDLAYVTEMRGNIAPTPAFDLSHASNQLGLRQRRT